MRNICFAAVSVTVNTMIKGPHNSHDTTCSKAVQIPYRAPSVHKQAREYIMRWDVKHAVLFLTHSLPNLPNLPTLSLNIPLYPCPPLTSSKMPLPRLSTSQLASRTCEMPCVVSLVIFDAVSRFRPRFPSVSGPLFHSRFVLECSMKCSMRWRKRMEKIES
jgi:hypothetical protein